jgi:hypothetical protein
MQLVWQPQEILRHDAGLQSTYICMSEVFEGPISFAVLIASSSKRPLSIMASIRYDTELMVNHIAAMSVPAGSKFVTVLDPDSRRPAVISLSTHDMPVLQLTQA